MVDKNGTAEIIAGSYNSYYDVYSGSGISAVTTRLNYPQSISGDSMGNIYIADSNSYLIRKVNVTSGIITTVAGMYSSSGFSSEGSVGTSSSLGYVQSLWVASTGDVYFIDSYSNYYIHRLDADGISHLVAGPYLGSSSGLEYTSALYTYLSYPASVSGDSAGNIYFSESNQHLVRKISTTEGYTGQLPCPAGTYSNALTSSNSTCVPCSPGYYSSYTASTSCSLIPPGKSLAK
jgi:hypothetical protein